MALLTILRYPDPRLYKKASPVAGITDEIRGLVRDMAETMYAAPGVGLARVPVAAVQEVVPDAVLPAEEIGVRGPG